MTTDPFTTAARKRAEQFVPLDGGEPNLIFRDRRQLVEMAEWARDRLAQQNPLTEAIRAVATTTTLTGQDVAGIAQALQHIAQEPTDAEVEAAAVIIWRRSTGSHRWKALREVQKDVYRDLSRAALTAAKEARHG